MRKRVALVLWDEAVKAYKHYQKHPTALNLMLEHATRNRLIMVQLASPHQVANGGKK